MKEVAVFFFIGFALFFLFWASKLAGAPSYSKYQFLKYVDSYVDITRAWTEYQVCNPTTADFVISSKSKNLFDWRFNEVKGNLKDSWFETLTNVTYKVPVHKETCSPYDVVVPANKTHDEVVFHYENCSDSVTFVDATRMQWQRFNPIGYTFKAGECKNVRIYGSYNPAYQEDAIAIDNVLSVAGFEYEEYDWWNTSWRRYKNITMTETAGVARSLEPVTVQLTGIDFSSVCELRIIGDNNESLPYEIISSDGSSAIRVLFQANVSANSNNQYSAYYSNPNADCPDFNSTDDFLSTDISNTELKQSILHIEAWDADDGNLQKAYNYSLVDPVATGSGFGSIRETVSVFIFDSGDNGDTWQTMINGTIKKTISVVSTEDSGGWIQNFSLYRNYPVLEIHLTAPAAQNYDIRRYSDADGDSYGCSNITEDTGTVTVGIKQAFCWEYEATSGTVMIFIANESWDDDGLRHVYLSNGFDNDGFAWGGAKDVTGTEIQDWYLHLENNTPANDTAAEWYRRLNNPLNVSLGVEKAQISAPQYANERQKYATPTVFDSEKTYGFQIDWTAEAGSFNTTNVTFEANFTDTVSNYTTTTAEYVTNDTSTTFYINVSQDDFYNATDFKYRWYAENGTLGAAGSWYGNITTWTDYTITKNSTGKTAALYLNGTNGDLTALNGTAQNFTAVSNIGEGMLWITTNFTGWEDVYTESSALFNYTVLNVSSTPTIINVTAILNHTGNYTAAPTEHLLTLRNVTVIEESYISNISHDVEQTVSITFTTVDNLANDLYATLLWNDTLYINDSVTMNNTHMILSKTFTTPTIEGASEKINLRWNYTYNSHTNITHTVHIQEIYAPSIQMCNATYTQEAFVLYPRNETTDFTTVNASIDMMFNFTSGNVTYTYNFSTTNETFHVCIYPPASNITIDGHVQYSNNSYQTRDHFFDNYILDNVSEDVNLLMIDTIDATKVVTFTIKDQFGTTKPDVLLDIQRWYPGLNSYKTVAVPKANSFGEASAYLELNTVYYRFSVEEDGDVLELIPAMLIIDDGSTIIEIDLTLSPEELIDWLKYWNKITGNCVYNNATFNLICGYSDTSDYLDYVELTVIKQGALTNPTICRETNTTTPSGSIVCSVGNASGSIMRYEFIAHLTTGTDDIFILDKGVLNVDAAITKLFGNCKEAGNWAKCREGAIVAFLMTTIAAFIGIYHPSISILTSLAGITVSWIVGLVAISMYSVVGLIFLAGMFIYRMRL